MIQIKPLLYYGQIKEEILKSHIFGKNILIVSSKTVWEKSYLSEVISQFSNKYIFKVYTHIKPNAPFSDIQKIIDDYKGNEFPDTIIAIGGGSIIDAAKALSVSFQNISIALFRKNTISYFKAVASELFKKGNLQYYMESVVQYAIDNQDKDIIPLNISQYSFVEVDFEEDYFKAKEIFG